MTLDMSTSKEESKEWKLSVMMYRGEVCGCALTIRNPKIGDKVKEDALKNPLKYKETYDQLMSPLKRPKKED